MRKTPTLVSSLAVVALAIACGGGTGGGGDDAATEGSGGTLDTTAGTAGEGPSATNADSNATSAGSDATGSDSASDTGGETDTGGPGSSACDPLPPPAGEVIDVAPGEDLAAALANAPAGATVQLADGTYDIGPAGLYFGADGVTVRSQSGDREAVILDGAYQQAGGGIFNVGGRANITIAHLSITRSRYHLVHVTGGPEGPSPGARLYDLHLSDPGEQAIKINSNYGFDTDDGEVACSLIELTDAGREQVMMYESSGSFCYTGGIDAHRAWNWVIRDNEIRGFWCSNGWLSEHGIHLWRGCRDTVVERNLLVDNARAIGFGLGQPAGGRTYDDDPCPGIAIAEHYGGIIRNNFIVAQRPELLAAMPGLDLGIGLEAACLATIVHNTVATAGPPYSSIEWRWPETTATIVNNLVTHNLRERDGATATVVGNLEMADVAIFEDFAGGDVHLGAGAAAAIDMGDAMGPPLAGPDYDGDARDGAPDIGADERVR
jgi:hypothetical protein